MGPISYTANIWLPVDPADRPAREELLMQGDKDRIASRPRHPRRQHREPHSDTDQFTHQEMGNAAEE